MAHAHRIAEIKGLSDEAKAKLTTAGIGTVEHLLARTGDAGKKAALAKELGVPGPELTEWINRADLMRLNGVGTQYADLLENVGVDSCKELQHRVPANLHAKMVASNEGGKFTQRTPTLAQVTDWITQAKTIVAESAAVATAD